MKHNFRINLILISFFFVSQVVGLLIVNQYIDHKKTIETQHIEYRPLPYDLERPKVENESTSFIYITIAVIIGTLIVLLLVKFNKGFIWKIWFFVTIWITLSIAFAAFMNSYLAAALALAGAILKLVRPNVIFQNISEIFIYGGLAAIFVPILNVVGAFMLLFFISIYDFIAVRKTKHMIKLAEFQSSTKVFAGLFIPYGGEKVSASQTIHPIRSPNAPRPSHSAAILGGGDIGFTLIFSGAVMKSLMLQETLLVGFLKTMVVPIFASIALFMLLYKGQKDKFYPAMPVLTVGCTVGYLIVLLAGIL